MALQSSMDRSLDEYRQSERVAEEREVEMRVADQRGRVSEWVQRDSVDGVWTAAMFTPCLLFPLACWFAARAPSPESTAFDWLLLALGSVGVFGISWCVVVFSGARRVARAGWTRRLRLIAGGGLAAAVLSLAAPVAELGEPIAMIARHAWIGPAVIVAACGFAEARIAKGRHGTAIARFGSIACIAAGIAPLVVDSRLVPLALYAVGAPCIGLAGIRLWQYYELRLLQGAHGESGRGLARGLVQGGR